MTVFTKRAVTIFAATDAFGAMRSVINGEVQTWGAEVETAINAAIAAGALVYATKADLDADLAHDANTGAWVVADSIDANNGIYAKSGASGSGSWTKVDDLPAGDDGWSPLFHILADGARRIIEIHDWTGGAGSKPQTGYLGATGIVADIAQATDVRGPQGASGDGSGDLVSTNNLSDLSSADTALINLGGGTSGIAVLKAEDTAALTTALAGAVDTDALQDEAVTNAKVAPDAAINTDKSSWTPSASVSTPAILTLSSELQRGKARPEWFYKSTDGTDYYPALKAAVDELSGATGGIIELTRASYNIDGEIQLNKPGLAIIGQGTGTTWDGLEGAASKLVGVATTGSVIRIMKENCRLADLVVDADATRQAATVSYDADDYNAGIRVEGEDVGAPEGDVFSTTMERVYSRYQPNDCIYMVGRIYDSYLLHVYGIGSKGGHGLRVDGGASSGRTNIAIPGLLTMVNGHFFGNKGCGIAIGNPNEYASTGSSFRCLLMNVETFNNDVNTALRWNSAFYDSHIFGDGNELIACAWTGSNVAGTANSHGSLAVGGRGTIVRSNRFLNPTRAARVIYNSDATTVGTTFENPHIRGATLAEAISVDMGATGTKIIVTDTAGGITSAASTTQQAGDDIQWGNERTIHGSLNISDFSSGRTITIADDGVATFEFDTMGTYGIVMINGAVAAAGPCAIAFRVGNNVYQSILGGDTAVVATGGGVLTGTTGTDGFLTVSSTGTNNKLYIENRTGASRVYTVTFLSVDGGRLKPGQ